MQPFKYLVEKNAFGVCSFLGERLNMPSSKVRLFFIYASALSMGSPIIIYMIIAWWLDIIHYYRYGRRRQIWDL